MDITASGPSLPAASTDAASGFARVISLTGSLASSWLDLLTAYLTAVAAAIVAFQKLAEPLRGYPPWVRLVLVTSPLILALVFHAIPAVVEQRRKRRLTEVGGSLQSGYFRLAPRDDEGTFTRADGKHQEILRWLEQPGSPVLYLTGLSGSGKSSLLAAWVLPNLARQNTRIIRLRGYQDPLTVLEGELRRPGVVWQKVPAEAGDMRSLLERACRNIRPGRLLVVFDQFEEFVILQDASRSRGLERLLSSLCQQPIDKLAFLLVFRSDYIGLVEKLGLPPLAQDGNWREIPPFTESAARDFMRGSGLEVSEPLLAHVLREAAEIEQTKGLIRPVTINLCGLVLGRFAAGLPRGFRPGGLVRGFLRESVFLPEIRDVAPRLIPHLITNYVTKRPRTVAELAQDSALDSATVRGCLRTLGQRERAIVRPLDSDQQTWEISHDFLVPLLDSIVTRWTVSFWRRFRAWLPWIAAICLVGAVVGASKWRKDPVVELTELGWQVQRTDKALNLSFEGAPPRGSIGALKRVNAPLVVHLATLDASMAEWSALKNLTTLDLSETGVSDLSPLRDLKSLATLNVSQTQSLRKLFFDTSIEAINQQGPGVSDLSPLKDLKKLTALDLSDNPVTDVWPLKDLKNLTMLNLRNTRVADVSPLKDLKNLSVLDLGCTLKDLPNLSTLYRTKVRDVTPLKDLKNLSDLHLDGTQVSDVSPLRDLKNLTFLDLSYTQVRDVSPLRDLKNLKALDLTDTHVRDVSPLRDLKNLKVLDLTGTHVSDVSPLKDLKNLQIDR